MAPSSRGTVALLTQYARYHRDRRNILIHLLGIPLIVVGIAILLSRPALALPGLLLTPAWLAWLATSAWNLTRDNRVLGVATTLLNLALVTFGHWFAIGDIAHWLGWGFAILVAGVVFQAIGHHWEGRKPAFTDDRVGLLVGPMFITAELLFAVGWGRALKAEIERVAGPTRSGPRRR